MIPRTKPINIICDSGVNQNQVNAVIDGIKELLQIAEVGKDVKINNFGVWRHKEWKNGEDLIPYHSVDWYAEDAFTGRKNQWEDYQLHSGLILDSFCDEPWQKNPHYDVMVTSLDLYAEGCNWVLGSALPLTGTVLSTYRWRKFSALDQYRFIKTAAMHEIGHVFGLPDRNRKDLKKIIGLHCANKNCIMRQGLTVQEWIIHTIERERHGPLCPQCKEDIYRFFRQT